MDPSDVRETNFRPGSHTLNLAGPLRRLRGDRQLLLDLIRFYLEDSPRVWDDLCRAAEQRDRDELLRAAHSLKGLAANFDAEEVIDTASTIELEAKTGELAKAASLVPRLKSDLNRLAIDLGNYRDAQSA